MILATMVATLALSCQKDDMSGSSSGGDSDVAYVSLSVNTVSSRAVGSVEGVALTATNKASYLYSMIYTDQLTNGNVYRTDHNMTVGQSLTEATDIIASLNENFNWLTNENETTNAAVTLVVGVWFATTLTLWKFQVLCKKVYLIFQTQQILLL